MVEESIRALVEIDQRWVPAMAGTSLYIRPTVIATETFLGVHPSHSYLYYVIVGPVGAYYKEGMNPVRILASDQYVRAVRGGLGAAKTMANYAASLYGAEEAQKAGYTQVLWLDGGRAQIPRRSRHHEHHAEDRQRGPDPAPQRRHPRRHHPQFRPDPAARLGPAGLGTPDLDRRGHRRRPGRPLEMWGTGTAAVISPVGELGYKNERYTINGGKTGALTQKLYDTIVGIQYGTAPDPHGWARPLGNRLGG